ncbi:unnamed protein product [Brassica oleracea var. botrytis]
MFEYPLRSGLFGVLNSQTGNCDVTRWNKSRVMALTVK